MPDARPIDKRLASEHLVSAVVQGQESGGMIGKTSGILDYFILSPGAGTGTLRLHRRSIHQTPIRAGS
jgi:hypothetical protein